jgi:signal transduction histidine kinase/ligand-binding sensor domain-containing protein
MRAARLFLLLFGLAVRPLPATELNFVLFNHQNKLPLSSASPVAQDPNGFIWLTSKAGVLRFDGSEFRTWAPGVLDRLTESLTISEAGDVVVLQQGGMLFHLTANSAEIVAGPQGSQFNRVQATAFDASGRLWVARKEELWLRQPDHTWREMFHGEFERNRIRRVLLGLDRKLYVVTEEGISRLAGFDSIEPVVRMKGINEAVVGADGSIWFIVKRAFLFEFGGGRLLQRLKQSELHSIALRGDTAWIGADSGLIALRPGGKPQFLGREAGIPPGGAVFIDREQNLWYGSFSGVMQIPEPDTMIWNERDGLPGSTIPKLFRADRELWVQSWAGVSRVVREGEAWRVFREDIGYFTPICEADGSLWMQRDNHEFVFWRNGRFQRARSEVLDTAANCSPRKQGGLWWAMGSAIYISRAGEVRRVADPMRKGESVDWILEDSSGRVWINQGEQVCSAPAESISHQAIPWQCQRLEGARDCVLKELDGVLWAESWVGVWEFDSGVWKKFAAPPHLHSRRVERVFASARGGLWITTDDAFLRIRPTPGGWETLEQLTESQGLPTPGVLDVIEESSGVLWLATNQGLVRVPAEARSRIAPPPEVRLVNVIVNGQEAASAQLGEAVGNGLPLELRFAALKYRSRSLLRFEYRLRSGDRWMAVDQPVLRLVDLKPGHYDVTMRATTDGLNWSSQPASVSFRVTPHWYLRWQWLSIFVAATALAIYLAYRARVAHLVALERQRMRIAMDLHDELGSGLGSIGILSDLAEQDSVAGPDLRAMQSRIGAMARELLSSLSDIVWSLRRSEDTLQALAEYLSRRGAASFPGGTCVLKTEFPEPWRKAPLSLAERRALLLIALEALHNAARHSGASSVTLCVRRDNSEWVISVADNGVGFSSSNGDVGNGLRNMRIRAEEIGASVSIESAANRGTRVIVRWRG